MKFKPYEDVPFYLESENGSSQFIFAEEASIAVSQPLSVTRQVDDNVLQILSYVEKNTATHSLDYQATTFNANEPFLVLLGPSGGAPQPIATSIRKIPKDTEIIFESGKSLFFNHEIEPDGNQYIVSLYAKSGDWSLSAEHAQQGYFNPLFEYVSESSMPFFESCISHEELKYLLNDVGFEPIDFKYLNPVMPFVQETNIRKLYRLIEDTRYIRSIIDRTLNFLLPTNHFGHMIMVVARRK